MTISSVFSNRRLSLAHRLALLTGSVIALCLAVAVFVAEGMLSRAAISGMHERLSRSTRQLATVIQAGVRQGLSRYASIAADSVLLHVLANSGGNGIANAKAELAARPLLESVMLATDSGLVVELWNTNRERVAYVGAGQSVAAATSPASLGDRPFLLETMAAAAHADSLRLSRLYVARGHVYFWIVQPVTGPRGVAGYVAHERRIATNNQPEESVRALAGSGLTVYYGNDDGSVWSTMGGQAAPPMNDSSAGALFTATPIPGTPLQVGMGARRDDVLAPVRATGQQLIVVAVVMIGAGIVAAFLIGRQVARPIVAVANAAEAIARGEYHTRVPRAKDAEVARLGESFNHMAIEVAAADETRRELAHMGRVAAVAELATSISHEVRQPLTAIRASAEAGLLLLQRPEENLDDAQRSFQDIVDDCDRASNVIDHVRLLLRKESGKTTDVDLNEICRQAVYLLRPDAARRRTALDLTLSPKSLTVIGDPVQLQQVVLNLTLNALDAASSSSRQRRVTVSTASAYDVAEIAVRDDGPGLTSDVEHRLFEPFFTTKTQGLGMGLTIVRSIVERHHGRVRAENVGAGGALFRVQLPVARTAAVGLGQLQPLGTNGYAGRA
jgi:signal transduction histidine kinase